MKRTKMVDQAKAALWKQSGLSHDAKGYVADARLNLVAGVTPEMIEADYLKGSGKEWLSKIRAIHSSAALTANTFGRWKTELGKLEILGLSGFQSLELEAKCPTGLGGTPPNLDVLLQSKDIVIGIESKLHELLTPTKPHFSPSYSRDKVPFCEDAWWYLLEHVRDWPPSHLDAAQLIKHYLGLRKQFPPDLQVFLLYLFWRPLNASTIPEYSRHAEDIERFRNAIARHSAVQFVSMSYPELWENWKTYSGLAEHASILERRYCIEI